MIAAHNTNRTAWTVFDVMTFPTYFSRTLGLLSET
jgi:hypothetical protein